MNGDRIQDPLFEAYYNTHRTHMLNVMEAFYQEKMLAGILNFSNVRGRILNNVPIDEADDEFPTIRLRRDEMDHLVRHLAAWSVRETRMTNYGRKGRTKELKDLEDIYNSL